ncbi:EF-P lysine aminoacylase EpmA [Psychrobacter sp. I-STPA6b]|uniref:EF-P lysine aminoacylase EpmA n=1 Tax=Psychrobacter sp. I-STPA6b TaxID=2585718 RepID=UPI001D0C93B2|nr:EF-P lysine aminoacylase EpmA [Psychrobacter sp. I-STPA6b]
MTNQSYHPTISLEMAVKRAEILAKIRQFFAQRDVLEVQTPLLSQAGNTDLFLQSVSANITHLDQPKTYYLHTSPEFAMKRLLASWHVPIYQICPVFRDNEAGSRHNIEFTMLEWYRPDYSLSQLGNELAELLAMLYGYPVIFDHYRYVDAFMDFVGIHPFTTSAEVLSAVAEDKGIVSVGLAEALGDDRQAWLDLLFSHVVEPHLGKDLPTLITDYPPATASLAKTATDKDGNLVAKRFELYINGIEIANAYDELADGQALRQRFEQDNAERAKRGLPIMPIDEHLLQACDDLPPCSGIAVGIDRLLMVLTGASCIDEVIGFGVGRA